MNCQVGTRDMRWRCIEAAEELLAPHECELVLGDLAEMDRSVWRGLGDVLSLAALRQIALWKSWRPWAASFGAGSAGEPVLDGMLPGGDWGGFQLI